MLIPARPQPGRRDRSGARSLLRQGLAEAIGLYQRHLSPHKGFSCAHRIYHGGSSCSQYCKEAILELGPIGAWSQMRRRFRDCKVAARSIQASRMMLSQGDRSQDGGNGQDGDQRRGQQSCPLDGCGARDCRRADFCQPDCLILGCEALSWSDGCDLGALDCGAADCCGGCSF